jgi:hypothetical protein
MCKNIPLKFTLWGRRIVPFETSLRSVPYCFFVFYQLHVQVTDQYFCSCRYQWKIPVGTAFTLMYTFLILILVHTSVKCLKKLILPPKIIFLERHLSCLVHKIVYLIHSMVLEVPYAKEGVVTCHELPEIIWETLTLWLKYLKEKIRPIFMEIVQLIIRVINWSRMRQLGYVTSMEEMINTYKLLVWKSEEKWPPGKHWCAWENGIKMYIKNCMWGCGLNLSRSG